MFHQFTYEEEGQTKHHPPAWAAAGDYRQRNSSVVFENSIFYNRYYGTGIPPNHPVGDENPWTLLYEVNSEHPTTSKDLKVVSFILCDADRISTARDERLYKHLTHLILSFVTVNADGSLKTDDVLNFLKEAPVQELAAANNVRLLIALGGANDKNFNALMTKAHTDSTILPAFADKVYNFVVEHKLHGVDLDMEAWWEFTPEESQRPAGSPAPAGISLTKLAELLRSKLGNDRHLCASLPATSYYGNNYEGQKLAQYVDWLGLMSYDFNGSFANSPVGPHSQSLTTLSYEQVLKYEAEQQRNDWDVLINPMISAQDGLWYWCHKNYYNYLGHGQRVPIEKMVVGVPCYGYDFSHANPAITTGSYNTIKYKDLYSMFGSKVFATSNIKEEGLTPTPDFVPANVRKYPNGYPWSHNVYYDSPTTAVEKLMYIKKVGGQGVMAWEAGGDLLVNPADVRLTHEGSILKALWDHSGNTKVTKTAELGASRGGAANPVGVASGAHVKAAKGKDASHDSHAKGHK